MFRTIARLLVLTGILFSCESSRSQDQAADSVEFLNGSQISGKILVIRKDEKQFDFQTSVAGRTVTRTYEYANVHAVTMGGKRFVLTPKKDSPANETGESSSPNRSRQEVLSLIKSEGSTPPDWYEATPLNHPKTLDLDWPLKPEGGWNNRKNVGQFIWDVVNPNESRWNSGIKLVHHCMKLHQGNSTLVNRDMGKLATMYFTLLQDYPRAAFWYQKSGATVRAESGIRLAECYWRLGNKAMALEMMRGKPLHLHAIKLLGDMEETKDALRIAELYGKTQVSNEAFLAAGDALRKVGRNDEAIQYYQRVLDSNNARNKEYDKRFKARAAGSIEAIRLYEQTEIERVADGTYTASSTGYNGALDVEVQVKDHKIVSVKVTDHKEKQYYAALADTPDQIISLQSVKNIDGTTGATITSQAIVHASAKALAKGAK